MQIVVDANVSFSGRANKQMLLVTYVMVIIFVIFKGASIANVQRLSESYHNCF